jgi:hypothetical protein
MDSKLITATWNAWIDFSDKADEAVLLSFIESNPALKKLPALGYPQLHRIRDIVLCGRSFRVMRAVLADSEQLFFSDITDPNLEAAGVPDWLTGEKLKAWIQAEEVSPSKDRVNWDTFR